MAGVVQGAGLGFKTGPQSAVNSIMANGNATHGSFYLTNDTHRLYIGNSDGSLSAVNEGVNVIPNVSYLPGGTNGTPSTMTDSDWDAMAGQFYYLTDSNILCVCSKRQWVQINPDTYLKATSGAVTVTQSQPDSNGHRTYTVTTTVQDDSLNPAYQPHTASGNFKIKTGNNITIDYDSTLNQLTLNGSDGAVYSFTGATNSGVNDAVDLILTNVNDSSDVQIVTFKKGNGGVYPTWNSNDRAIVLNGGGLAGGSFLVSETNGAVTLTVRDGNLNPLSTTITPEIKIGGTAATETAVTPTYNSTTGRLTWDLDVYTKDEVDSVLSGRLQSFEAMYFAGTIGGTTTPTSISGLTSLNNIRSGATFKFIEEISGTDAGTGFLSADNIEGWKSSGAAIGDMLIITFTPNTDTGLLDWTQIPADAKATFIPSGDDTDTYYQPIFGGTGNETNTLKFKRSGNLAPIHKAIFNGGTNITVSESTEVGSGQQGGYNKTLTIAHDTITTTNSTGTAVTQASTNYNPSFTAITGLTLNNGHITDYETSTLQLWTNSLSQVTNVASAEATAGTTSSVKLSTTYKHANMAQAAKNDWKLTSNTLNISAFTAGNDTTTADIRVDMVWGEFHI